jgi:hypothetical protein
VLDAGYWMLDTGYWMLDAGYWMLDAGILYPEALEGYFHGKLKKGISNIENRTLNVEQYLDTGYWILDTLFGNACRDAKSCVSTCHDKFISINLMPSKYSQTI